ncbi:coronafacic acid synthetase [Streptomyces sp. NPDC054884]|uniref:coronafacic acid synthetase n=1 Tax=Streptomyces sp. ME08-AFT2 TaxID=3028683 RepID=UPI0029B808D1|nr:coronafacic acid synthetase [Streptomyces sp. ME08-AFT2]MDX3311251.1 coronafacic acid synthetase [Streptomyces sp. ME08-AFT2]
MNPLSAPHTYGMLAAPRAYGMRVVGEGVAVAPDLSAVRPRQKASLYADPLSWLVLDAVEQALGACGGDVAPADAWAKDGVGHIAVSDLCTTHTMRQLAGAIAEGRFSPLRFSGANPGSICSLPSQLLGFSGPTMTLSMPPEEGLPPALAVARAWLRQDCATRVIVTAHRADAASGHRVTSTILTADTADTADTTGTTGTTGGPE